MRNNTKYDYVKTFIRPFSLTLCFAANFLLQQAFQRAHRHQPVQLECWVSVKISPSVSRSEAKFSLYMETVNLRTGNSNIQNFLRGMCQLM